MSADGARLRDAGFLPTPVSLDPEKPILLAPDGRRLVSVEEALAELLEKADE